MLKVLLQCSSSDISSSCGVSNGVQRYWTAPANSALSPSYVLDGIPMGGTTYYSAPTFYQVTLRFDVFTNWEAKQSVKKIIVSSQLQ